MDTLLRLTVTRRPFGVVWGSDFYLVHLERRCSPGTLRFSFHLGAP